MAIASISSRPRRTEPVSPRPCARTHGSDATDPHNPSSLRRRLVKVPAGGASAPGALARHVPKWRTRSRSSSAFVCEACVPTSPEPGRPLGLSSAPSESARRRHPRFRLVDKQRREHEVRPGSVARSHHQVVQGRRLPLQHGAQPHRLVPQLAECHGQDPVGSARLQPQTDSGVNDVGRSADDTSLRAAQEHLPAADDEVDASVSGNDGSAAAHRSPERALLTQDRFGIHVSIVELRATRVQRGCHGWIFKVTRSRW